MPRSSAQSDFTVQSDPEPAPTPMAGSRATKIILWFTALVLGALVLLTLIGPHVPSGE